MSVIRTLCVHFQFQIYWIWQIGPKPDWRVGTIRDWSRFPSVPSPSNVGTCSFSFFHKLFLDFLHFCNVCVNILVIDQEGLCRWENNTFFVSCEVKRNCSHSILKHFILFASQHLFFLQNKHYQTIPKVFKKRLYWGLVDLVRFEFCMFSGSLIKLVQSLCSFWKAELEFLSNREVSRWIPSVVKFLQAGFKLCIRAGTGYANLPHSFE